MQVLIILLLQYFLSTRKKVFWGAIIPIFYILILSYLKIYGIFEGSIKEFWLFSIIGIAALIIFWAIGRKSLKKKRIKELDKMESYDLN